MLISWFRRLSLPLKVTSIFILLIAIALGAGLGAILVSDTRTFEQDAFAYADHRAWLVADFSAAPLSFSDHQGATEILARLSGLEGRELVAALYDEQGKLFASYGSGDNWKRQLDKIGEITDGIQKA